MGQQSTYTPEQADAICEQLQEGRGLREVCRELGLSDGTVLRWVREREDFAKQYAYAREIGDDAEFDRLTDMASEPPPKIKGFTDAGWVQWKKMQLDQFKWNLARKRPKKYGDRVDLNVGGQKDNPLALSVTLVDHE